MSRLYLPLLLPSILMAFWVVDGLAQSPPDVQKALFLGPAAILMGMATFLAYRGAGKGLILAFVIPAGIGPVTRDFVNGQYVMGAFLVLMWAVVVTLCITVKQERV